MKSKTECVSRSALPYCLSAFFVAALLGPSFPASATHVGEDLQLDQQTVSANNQLIGALRNYEQATSPQRDVALQRLVDVAARRRAQLVALLERNPKLAAARVLPSAVRSRLPAQAMVQVESDVSITGRIEATIFDDFDRGRATQRTELVDAAGKRLIVSSADMTDKALLRLAGKRVRVGAVQIDGRLLVRAQRDVQYLAADGSTSTGPTAQSGAVVQGEQKTLFIMVNFSDAALTCTKTDLQSRLLGSGNGSMNDAYRQSSAGRVSFSGDVVGPFPINYSSTGTCDPSAWATAASAAAKAAGYDPAAYARVSYALPSNNTCNYAGLATLGGQAPTPSWILRCDRTGVFSHEIGHNLLFHHASTPTSEYGDATDPMGAAANVQFNAANRVMAGWAGGSQLVDVATGGSYAVDAIENMSSTNPLVLRMPKADTGDSYYVSLRQAVGNDVNLPLYANGALSVHYATGTLPAQTFRVANLAVGQSWTDGVNGLSVTHQGLTATGATVAITRGGATCSRSAPSVSATPLSQSAATGGTVTYAVTVSNKNSTACASSAFNLSQVVPPGFSGTLSSSSVTLAPGASATVSWSVSSAATVASATYDVTARASESSTTNTGEVHASFTVLTSTAPPPPPPPADTTPPALAITSPAAGALLATRRGSATISATASDASGVLVVEFLVDGKLIASDTSSPYTASWNLRKAGAGAHAITVRARDGVGNTAEQSIPVTVSK